MRSFNGVDVPIAKLEEVSMKNFNDSFFTWGLSVFGCYVDSDSSTFQIIEVHHWLRKSTAV